MSWRKMMTTLALLATFSAPALLQGQAHDAALLTGSFDLEFEAPWGAVLWTFDLEQDGEDFTGASDQGVGTFVLQGSMSGHEIEFFVELKDGPHPLDFVFAGKVEADGIRGSVRLEDGSNEKWTLTRVAETGNRR